MTDIYRDGSYVANNPSLHEEDSEYKLRYIQMLLEGINFGSDPIRVLDIGGGAGIVAAQVCRLLSIGGMRVECYAYDLSVEMLAAQRRNNPYLTLATSDFNQIKAVTRRYDLALLIDVIEHISDNGPVADEIGNLSQYVLYNIPTERNLFDWLRNLYTRGRYYPLQTASLGHVHFYSAVGAKRFVASHHHLLRWIFADYCGHVLDTPHPDYIQQQENPLRRAELLASRLIYRYLRPLAPHLIQGSMFLFAEGRGTTSTVIE